MLPAAAWLRESDRASVTADLVAGLVAGAVVIPQAMAYGTVGGLPVQAGLYTCIFPMAVYALLGGSRRMSLSTTSTIAALTATAIAAVGSTDPVATAMTLTFLVGVLLVVARVVRLGFLVECISEPVLIGLKVGVGLTIMAAQLPTLLGLPDPAGGFLHDVAGSIRHLGDASATTAALSIGTLAALVALKRWAPHVPGPLLAVVGGIVVVAVLHLDDHGVATIPEVPRGLPLPALPRRADVGPLLPYALAIGLMALLESISVARICRRSEDPPLDEEHELVAVGAASVVGSFFQTLPAAGGFSQTLVNDGAGARTQLSELVTAGLAVVVALVLAPLLGDLPRATLAAVVVLVVSSLIDLHDLARLGRIDPTELGVAIAVGVLALLTNLLVGVAAGVFLTFWLVLRGLNHPTLVELGRAAPGAELEPIRPGIDPVPGLLVVRIEGGLYTVNVRGVQADLQARVATHPEPLDVLLLDVAGTADTSITVMDAFAETDEHLALRGVTLWIAGLPTRAEEKVRRTQAWAPWVAAGRLHRTVNEAVRAYESRSTA